MNEIDARLARLRVFLTGEHPCSYLPGRRARNLVVEPGAMDATVHGPLARLGFRRSGTHVYRPHCEGCQACIPLRVAVERFDPSRAQRRAWARNRDLKARWTSATLGPEHRALLQRYLDARHPGGGMDETDPADYEAFFGADWSDTALVEFRLDARLLAAAVVDRHDDGLSAVYTFYDPGEGRRSLGVYAVLWQIHQTRRLSLPWLYLGYWVRACDKMRYKASFRPHQLRVAGHWVDAPARDEPPC